ncbi:uncharacterized protein LOC132732843 [Ruditapes philippinarum]|uniref:uncharacterized protein LOC132732843 n=1 Tax=Ruditapes philippinarum TaxID=129788 RepID=UPI00295BE499|nr:uncharacterized protein LOC132732843 [Ruditapes philippinarum]
MCPSFFRNQPTDVPESKNDQEEPKKDESNKDKTEGEKENETRNDDGTGDEMNDDRTDDEMNDIEVTNDEQQQQQSDNRGKKRSQDSTDGMCVFIYAALGSDFFLLTFLFKDKVIFIFKFLSYFIFYIYITFCRTGFGGDSSGRLFFSGFETVGWGCHSPRPV